MTEETYYEAREEVENTINHCEFRIDELEEEKYELERDYPSGCPRLTEIEYIIDDLKTELEEAEDELRRLGDSYGEYRAFEREAIEEERWEEHRLEEI